MVYKLTLVVAALTGLMAQVAMATDSPFTSAQLIHMTQLSLQDYATNNPDMATSITGFKVNAAAPNAKVIIYMQTDTMNMTANYLCVPNGSEFGCHFQN